MSARRVRDLFILMLEPREITKFKMAEGPEWPVLAETEKAFMIHNGFTGNDVWVPKSVSRMGRDGALWVEEWFFRKELS